MHPAPFELRAGGGLLRQLLRCQQAYDRTRGVRSALQGVLIAVSAVLWLLLESGAARGSPFRAFALGSWLAAALLLAGTWAVELRWRRRRDALVRASGRP